MLGHRRRRWPNIIPTWGDRLLFVLRRHSRIPLSQKRHCLLSGGSPLWYLISRKNASLRGSAAWGIVRTVHCLVALTWQAYLSCVCLRETLAEKRGAPPPRRSAHLHANAARDPSAKLVWAAVVLLLAEAPPTSKCQFIHPQLISSSSGGKGTAARQGSAGSGGGGTLQSHHMYPYRVQSSNRWRGGGGLSGAVHQGVLSCHQTLQHDLFNTRRFNIAPSSATLAQR